MVLVILTMIQPGHWQSILIRVAIGTMVNNLIRFRFLRPPCLELFPTDKIV